MTQNEFNLYWTTYTLNPNTFGGDPGSVFPSGGIARFITNDDGSVGIRQNLTSGFYNISLSIGEGFDIDYYFLLYTSGSLIYNFSSSGAGTYTIPAYVNQNIELLWTGSGKVRTGSLDYIRAEAPQTLHSETIYTISGTISRTRYDGREDYTGELGGTRLKVTTGEQFPNPYLSSNYTVSSSNPELSFGLIFYTNLISLGGAKTWGYASSLVKYPISIIPNIQGSNTNLWYKINTSSIDYNSGAGSSSISPSANFFTASSGATIYVPGNTYLSLAVSSSNITTPFAERVFSPLYTPLDRFNPVSILNSLILNI